MAEDDFSGEIVSVPFHFVRPAFNDLFPKQTFHYTCSVCLNRADEIWFKTQGTHYRGTYCASCKEREQDYDKMKEER